MAHLSVNLNAVAHLRNRRDLPWPDVVEMGRLCLEAGAAGLTVHPRPDERHIRRSDVFDLSHLLRAGWNGREFNIEGYPTEDFLRLCETVRPDQVTLVPDDPSQPTSDHGWDIDANESMLAGIVERLHAGSMRVSLFIDADPAVPKKAAGVGADRIEFYTGPYGNPAADRPAELARLVATAEACRKTGSLGMNAGHDLTLENIPALINAIPDLEECSIGHALTADALKFGFAGAVGKYIAALATV